VAFSCAELTGAALLVADGPGAVSLKQPTRPMWAALEVAIGRHWSDESNLGQSGVLCPDARSARRSDGGLWPGKKRPTGQRPGSQGAFCAPFHIQYARTQSGAPVNRDTEPSATDTST
jgi:hypothetical protein